MIRGMCPLFLENMQARDEMVGFMCTRLHDGQEFQIEGILHKEMNDWATER